MATQGAGLTAKMCGSTPTRCLGGQVGHLTRLSSWRTKVKYLAAFILFVVVSSVPVSAQSNDVAVFAVGQYTHPVQGFTFGIPSERQSSKDSFGMGVEYRHWLKDNGLSVEFSRVASNATFPIWLMGETRYKFNAADIRRFRTHSLVST